MTPQPVLGEDIDIVWRDLNYDVGWEATSIGIIRCRKVLNRRGDIFNTVEGTNLHAMECVHRRKSAFDLLHEVGHVRHIEVKLQRAFGPERLYLTGMCLRDGRMAGTFSALDPILDDVVDRQLSLLSHVSESRWREEAFRRESEIMLRGMRLLLGNATIADKILALANLMCEAIGCVDHAVLRLSNNGTLHGPLLQGLRRSAREGLAQFLRDQISPVTVHRGNDMLAETLRQVVGTQTGDVALVLSPVGSERVALVCPARGSQSFSPESIDFASRVALLLRQVLVLKEEQDKLIQTAKLSALGQISASLAHELRQPLNTISVAAHNLELLAQDGATADAVAAKATRILSQVERASNIIDRIRRFSRKSANDFSTVNLWQLASGVAGMVDHVAANSGVRLTVDVPTGLEACCDAIQIEQILVNLVRNALDALEGNGTLAGKIAGGHVAIRGYKHENQIVLRVEDNGPGFPRDALERPLETFYTTKAAEEGTGLGLSICNTIARDHAGRLEIGNHENGAYVELYLQERHL